MLLACLRISVFVVLLMIAYQVVLFSSTREIRTSNSSPFAAITPIFFPIPKNIDRSELEKLLPPRAVLPSNIDSVRLTLNPAVHSWFVAEMQRALKRIDQNLPISALRDNSTHMSAAINAVLIDGDSHVRVMYSNSSSTYFGIERLPLASTAKLFVAVALGEFDSPDSRYCNPGRFSGWLTIDAARPGPCSAKERTVRAAEAFAHSLPGPLLWRSNQVLSDAHLGNIFQKMGMLVEGHASLRNSAILGQVKGLPLELHRAAHLITLALADRHEEAKIPKIVDFFGVKDEGQEQRHLPSHSAVMEESYKVAFSSGTLEYIRAVLRAPIRFGTLKELSVLERSSDNVRLLWGKTGTFAVKGETLLVWIVGGLIAQNKPYSWMLLIKSQDPDRFLGNTNAAAFASIVPLFVEAAMRDSRSDSSDEVRLSVEKGAEASTVGNDKK